MARYRLDYRKNVVLCGFDEVEIRSMNLHEAQKSDYEEDKYQKCPHLIYVDKLEDARKHRGLVLFLKVDYDFNYVEFDRKYRKKLDYWYIYAYNQDFEEKHPKYTNIVFMTEEWLYSDWYDGFVDEIDNYFKKHGKLKIHQKRKELLEEIHKFLRKKEYISTQEIAEQFNISIRNVERYMHDIYLIYNDIGYDFSKYLWYICK